MTAVLMYIEPTWYLSWSLRDVAGAAELDEASPKMARPSTNSGEE